MSVGDRVRSSLLHARTGEITRVEDAGLVYVRWDGEPQVKGKLTHAYYLLPEETATIEQEAA